MYRVLLVDDDMIVRMFLKDMLRWEDFGFEITGSARDGEEALELTQSLSPDLILTDISMPRLDGIELTRRLRTAGYDGAIVALSCHDDFSFVKSAMQYGADDYILKNHLSEDTLATTLRAMCSKIEQRRADSSQQEKLQSLAQVGRQSIRREFLRQILSGPIEESALRDLITQAGLHGIYRRCAVMLFQSLDADDGQQQAFAAFCDQQAQTQQAEQISLTHGVCAVLVDLTAVPSTAVTSERLTTLHHAASHFAKNYLDVQLVCTQSGVCTGVCALAQALRQAYDLLQHGFYAAGFYIYGETTALHDTLPPQAAAFAQALPERLRHNDAQALAQAWEDSLSACAQVQVRPGVLLDWLTQCDRTAGVHREQVYYASLHMFSQYAACGADYERRRQEIQRAALPDQLNPSIRQAAEYIQAHCTESIGLGHAARHAGLAPTYFSTLFKKELGIGFAEYLLTERLQRVCQQLEQSGDTIRAISERTGFPDYQYFCKTFKKRIGVTPAAYRRGARTSSKEKHTDA